MEQQEPLQQEVVAEQGGHIVALLDLEALELEEMEQLETPLEVMQLVMAVEAEVLLEIAVMEIILAALDRQG
jgi:hypothetical protein